MKAGRPRVLIAAPADVMRQLRPALAGDVDVLATGTWSEAVGLLEQQVPDAIVVCYAFDEVRPFRLLHYVQQEWQGPQVPIILVRALPLNLGDEQEAQIREAYRTLGVLDFFNLWEEAERHGTEVALQRFRHSVLSRLAAPK